MPGEQAEASAGRRGAQVGRLFGVELLTVQVVWLALLGASSWLVFNEAV
jgi:hypothetical protein